MFDPLYKIFEENNISALKINNPHNAHNFWRDFDETTFIFCVVRNPVDRTISDFCYWANYGDNNIRTHNNGRDSECPFYTKEDFMKWLDLKHIENYQTKIISNNNNLLLKQNINRINLLIRAEDIQHNENKLRKIILDNFNIKHSFKYYPPDFEKVFMPMDGKIADVIHKNIDIIEKIKELNQQDLWVYDQASNIF